MTSIIRWQEPPVSTSGRRGNKDRERAVETLKQNPGKWALVAESVNGSAVTPWKKLGCEAVGRRNDKDPKKSDIYVRWPTKDAKAPQVPGKVAAVSPASPPSSAESAKVAARSGRATPAKATLPITTPTDTARLDLEDPRDRALLEERRRFEANRAARLNKGRAK